ncbi:MAG: S-methyl-5-thioribose-1-phosphate isomerase [Balneolales bacterium]
MPKASTQPSVFESIKWVDDHLRIIDQTYLPNREIFLDIYEVGRIWEAIKSMRIRGAPAIGLAAAYGLYLGVKDLREDDLHEFETEVKRISVYLASARPTAANLQWALDKMIRTAHALRHKPITEIKNHLLNLAHSLLKEDKRVCADIGKHGQILIPDKADILTHCNTGSLATGQYGTALSVIYHAHMNNKNVHVWVDETRPLFQGSRLTSWELQRANIHHHIIADSAAGWVMQHKNVDMIIVGTDRVARNGDAANKIGTYSLAVLAKHHNIPFYIAAPLSSIDMNVKSGDSIPIEMRSEHELRKVGQYMTAPNQTPAYNPAFDITPYQLITAFITEKGVVKPDYAENLAAITAK